MPSNKATRQPDILLPTTDIATPLQVVSQQDFDDHKKDFKFQKDILNWTFGFIVAILIVCFISFITFITDAWRFNSTTITEYNKNITDLKKENADLKTEKLNKAIEALTNKVTALEATVIDAHKSIK